MLVGPEASSAAISLMGPFLSRFSGSYSDVWGYPSSYIISGAVQLLALPFILLALHEKAPSDEIKEGTLVETAGQNKG